MEPGTCPPSSKPGGGEGDGRVGDGEAVAVGAINVSFGTDVGVLAGVDVGVGGRD
jgi:hypothetical protein